MEQIINGVDVSGCDYISQDGRCEVQLALKRVNFECSQIFDCLYKQLRRKEVGCNTYKQALDEIEDYIEKYKKKACAYCCYKGTDGCEGEQCFEKFNNILQIIQKVKGE